MPTNTLSDNKCRSAKPAERPYKLFDGNGLFLYITPTGGKRWRLAYRQDGRPQTAAFGAYPLVSLADARARRDELRLRLAQGEAPKPKIRPTITLEKACEAYWAGRHDLSDSYRDNAERALKHHILPKLGECDVARIERAEVLAALLAMDAAGKLVYVRKTRMWLGQVLDWCVEHGHCASNPVTTINPSKAFSHRQVVPMAALELAEIPAFVQRLALEGQILSAMACRLLALTWVRTVELRMMRWDEIDGKMWRIPAGKMKRRRDHLVPLSRQALELLERLRLRRRGDYVFPSDHRDDRPMSENAVLYLMARMGYAGRMTGHGWRSVASTWANEHGYDRDVIERQLAHAPEDKTRAAYNRAMYIDQRRAMLQDYADWLFPESPSAIKPALTNVERCQ